VKAKPSPDGLLVVDYEATGRPIGIEITAPLAVPLGRLNQLLAELGQTPLAELDYRPVRAASGRARTRKAASLPTHTIAGVSQG
jgi:hypothetical protein